MTKFYLEVRQVPSWHLAIVVVNDQHFSKTAPRIFLILCMEVHHYEGKKRAGRFVPEKPGFPVFGPGNTKMGQKRGFPSINMQKRVQFC